MLRDALVPLEDMRRYAADALEISAGQTREGYAQDMRLRYAIERCLIVIGEALAAVRRIDPTTAGRITASNQIIGMRNILVHGYRIIDPNTTWDSVENDLPVLLTEVTALIEEGEREHLPGSL